MQTDVVVERSGVVPCSRYGPVGVKTLQTQDISVPVPKWPDISVLVR